MDILDQLHALRHGALSRRSFSKSLLAAGIGMFAVPLGPKRMIASEHDAQFLTWSGYDLLELFGDYLSKNGNLPDFSIFNSVDEALNMIGNGLVPDVAHPCHVDLERWIDTGLFQPIDLARLSNWPDVMSELADMQGNIAGAGQRWLAPFDWGCTSITYRTDLFDLDGEESWNMLWDRRYSGRLGSMAAGNEAWWCGAIKAGVPFESIATEDAFERIATVLREQHPLILTYADDVSVLEAGLSSGALVAAMTWNSSAVSLYYSGVPVRFARPKEGALAWVCGMMIHKDAPNPDRAYDVIDSMLSEDAGKFIINEYGYGHSNRRSFDAFDPDTLDFLGISKTPGEVLNKGNFPIPQNEAWQRRMTETFDLIKAGY